MTHIIFVNRDGSELGVDAQDGLSVMEVAIRNGIDIEATCEGSLACATCHLIVAPEFYDSLDKPSAEEEDMLDLAFNITKTSRLSCQIRVSPAIEGMKFIVPESF